MSDWAYYYGLFIFQINLFESLFSCAAIFTTQLTQTDQTLLSQAVASRLRDIGMFFIIKYLMQGFSNFICWRPPYLFLEILRPFKVSCDPLDLKYHTKAPQFGNLLVKLT
jgi:hypothetical protein